MSRKSIFNRKEPAERGGEPSLSNSLNLLKTGVLCAMVALYGCGSQESNINQSSSFTEARIALDAVHQKTLETLPTPPPDVLARQEPFPFTASATFARITRTYSFYNSAGTFRHEPTSGQRDQIWNPPIEKFTAIFSGVNCDTFVDGLPSQMLEEDGVRLTLTNDVTGDTFFLGGLTKPSGSNVTFTVDETNSTSDGKNYRQFYSGVARFNSGWTAAFSKSSLVGPSQTSNTYTQSSLSRINFVQPIASQKTITIANATSSQNSNNTTLDFDISTGNTTVQGWEVQVEKDNQVVKTLTPTTDFRGPGVGAGSNPLHVSLNWDNLADNNQAVTGNITWVMTAKATTFVPGGNLNDGVNSVQARLASNLDPPELSILAADSETLLASSSPEPYPGSSIDPVAALDGALSDIGTLAANFLDLSKSNDQMTLNLPVSVKIRYVVKNTPATAALNSVDVSVTTSQSNKTSLTRTLQRRRDLDTAQSLRFESTLKLVSGTPQGDEIALKNFPNSFTTFDYNAGDGVNYEDGNAQDGLEWERREAAAGGTQLGRAARLKPSEKASRSYRSTIPPITSAIQAAGFEDLIVERQSLKAWTRVKNQAHSLYVSSHGLTSGDLFADDAITGVPASSVQPTWSNGNLDLAIFAGCSVLDIGNFNGWTNPGAGASPGLQWKSAGRPASSGRPGCIFLGYNATAPLGNVYEPAGSLHGDTRILGFYYDQLGQQSNPASSESKALAWLLANAGMEQRIADDACAITDDYYYFIRTKSIDASGFEIKDPHVQNDEGSFTKERAIWKIHRSQWGKVGKAAFDGIPLTVSGKILMRRLPAARMGESGKI